MNSRNKEEEQEKLNGYWAKRERWALSYWANFLIFLQDGVVYGVIDKNMKKIAEMGAEKRREES